jgi:hypothetical protein
MIELFSGPVGYRIKNLGCRQGWRRARGDVEVYDGFPSLGGPCLMRGGRYRLGDGLVSVLQTTDLLHVIGIFLRRQHTPGQIFIN